MPVYIFLNSYAILLFQGSNRRTRRRSPYGIRKTSAPRHKRAQSNRVPLGTREGAHMDEIANLPWWITAITSGVLGNFATGWVRAALKWLRGKYTSLSSNYRLKQERLAEEREKEVEILSKKPEIREYFSSRARSLTLIGHREQARGVMAAFAFAVAYFSKYPEPLIPAGSLLNSLRTNLVFLLLGVTMQLFRNANTAYSESLDITRKLDEALLACALGDAVDPSLDSPAPPLDSAPAN